MNDPSIAEPRSMVETAYLLGHNQLGKYIEKTLTKVVDVKKRHDNAVSLIRLLIASFRSSILLISLSPNCI